MKFTYQAPVEYNDLTSGFKTVESEYSGPHDFKVYVDPITRKITRGVEFDHDGHPEIHGGSDISVNTDDMEMVYLHSHNPNHIVLMAMITNHEDHKTDTKVEVVCEKYNMVYQRHEHPALDHTYDLRLVTIDKNGIVTYPWWQMPTTWDMLVRNGKGHKQDIVNRMNNTYMHPDLYEKAKYCCEIIDYVLANEISKNHPWKLAWPIPETVTLDNSVPIGLGDTGIPNGPRDYDSTTAWGLVPHEFAYHMDGDDVVIDGVCPTTPEEAAKLQPWTELTEDHPTHSERVSTMLEVQQRLIDNDPNIQLTNEILQNALLQHLEDQAAPATPAP
jgi:hypothetical protein